MPGGLPERFLGAVIAAGLLSFAAAAGSEGGGRSGVLNHLAKEKSPYLLQHADNPVDWHPWGAAAFEKAAKEQKPIFLSIGYSTCHWCHVMERESFEDPAIAAVLNAHFISVKVDREERPDVDKVYMTAASAAGWGGGWPLSLWLTPERKPFYGGTYFPPASSHGRPGFKDVLERIARYWKEDRGSLLNDADKLTSALERRISIDGREGPLDASALDALASELLADSDPVHGGFGGAPKFPMPANLAFLLRTHARTGDGKPLREAERTLRAMARGGIFDHVGGGFHRYSVDAQWRVPHFEKMLYDNAQLATVYLEAYQAGGGADLARVAESVLDYVLRDMTHPEGGFYSAEDADSAPETGAEKSEGAFYVWSRGEIESVLGARVAAVFARRYGVREEGSALDDPHGEFSGKNILYEALSAAEAAGESGLTERAVRRLCAGAAKRLLFRRAERPRPGLDDKVLASWNGLMLTALARGYQVLEEPRYLHAAEKAAAFLRARLYDESDGALYHRWRDGERAIGGMADDYAFLIQGLLDLYEASFDPRWIEWAEALADRLQRDFYQASGGYRMTAPRAAPHLLVEIIEDSDNVEPSASSVAALALLRLSGLTGREDFRAAAEKTLHRFGGQMARAPRTLPAMMAAADFALSKPAQLIISGPLEDPATREMLRLSNSLFWPNRILMVLPTEELRRRLGRRLPALAGMVSLGGKPTAYLCKDYACERPTTDPAALADLLGAGRGGRP